MLPRSFHNELPLSSESQHSTSMTVFGNLKSLVFPCTRFSSFFLLCANHMDTILSVKIESKSVSQIRPVNLKVKADGDVKFGRPSQAEFENKS